MESTDERVDAKLLRALERARCHVIERVVVFHEVRTHSRVHEFVCAHDARRGVAAEWHFEDPFGQVATRLTPSSRARFDDPRSTDEAVLSAGDQLRVDGAHVSEAMVSESSTLVAASSPKTRCAARAAPR